ncbi:MAG: hypothetical protein OEZ32_00565 [Nitrospinota bacterium]|nr:hypothetical protein [Nitrospinota bacterium]
MIGPSIYSAGRMAVITVCLALFTVSAIKQALTHHSLYEAFFKPDRKGDNYSPMQLKEIALRPVLPDSGVELAGYYSDLYEVGYSKWGNFFRARYVALPLILTRFHPSQPLVLVEMSSADGVKEFCLKWGYKVSREGAPGVALLEKAP